MAKIKKLLTPRVTMGLFVLALILLLLSSVSGTRAALSYVSDDYTTAMELQHIGVGLAENGELVSQEAYGSDGSNEGVLLSGIPGGEDFLPNKAYDEVLTVRNLGTIGQYVRVTVYRYWVDENGNKRTDLNPAFIGLDFKDGEDGWIIDKETQTLERTVLYYNSLLGVEGETPSFVDHLTVDSAINNVYTATTDNEGRTILSYDYNGARFCVKVVVDAVQEHNAEAAMKSVWGVDMADVMS